MSQARSSPPPGPGAFGPGRIFRLARKELRETLRDRRTIITLVLMPLLVYPVLGVAFRQFLLTSFQQPSDVHLQIAAENQEDIRTLMVMVSQGDHLLHQRQPTSAGAPLAGGPILGADLGAADPTID